jgi:mannose-6-phosphate isomerase
MTTLYPLKFDPILKERVWGGDKILKFPGKNNSLKSPVGESWELSGVQDDISVVSNGFLAGNEINDLIETYLGELVGDSVYERYGNELPLLIKILDINGPLSLQIHPDDNTAMERHNSYGKTECWYIMEADPSARIYLGLNRALTAQEFYDMCKNDTIEHALNVISPKKGDLIYIAPGTLHAAKGGILVAEIQQVSDITYRVYDWGREHDPSTARVMHMDLAIDCIDYNQLIPESLLRLEGFCETPYFKIQEHEIREPLIKNSHFHDGFTLFFAIDGSVEVLTNKTIEKIERGEVVMIPASLGEYKITGKGKVLEITCI